MGGFYLFNFTSCGFSIHTTHPFTTPGRITKPPAAGFPQKSTSEQEAIRIVARFATFDKVFFLDAIDTGGGANIGGDASTGRDLTGRDRISVDVTNTLPVTDSTGRNYTLADVVIAIIGDPIRGVPGLREEMHDIRRYFVQLDRRIDGMETRLGRRIDGVEDKVTVRIVAVETKQIKLEELVAMRNATTHRIFVSPWMAVVLAVLGFLIAVVSVAALWIVSAGGV